MIPIEKQFRGPPLPPKKEPSLSRQKPSLGENLQGVVVGGSETSGTTLKRLGETFEGYSADTGT